MKQKFRVIKMELEVSKIGPIRFENFHSLNHRIKIYWRHWNDKKIQ